MYVSTLAHVLAQAQASGGTNLEVVIGIAVPIFLFVVVPAIVFSIKGVIKFAGWLAHQQESADRVATSNEAIADNLKEYIDKNDIRVRAIEQDVVVLKDWRDRGSANHNREGGWG